MNYPSEPYTAEEQAQLNPYFTNLEGPVFALRNLPETVKGAMFARYSRYPGTLRRMFLDEFADSLPEQQSAALRTDAEGSRAAELYERIFVGYGDDSVAQLGGAHIACEWVSNVLTKILQRPRLGAYLEQSTRYIAYDSPMPGGGYRYYRNPELGSEYTAAMDRLFTIYSEAIPAALKWAEDAFPRSEGESEAAYRRAIKAKALDLLRGLLPAASLSHMGIFATGQTYEQLVLHLLAHPLPEARTYGQMILAELKQTIPSFVSRIERPDRGGRWIDYLEKRSAATEQWAGRFGLNRQEGEQSPSVRLLRTHGSEDDLLAALLFEATGTPEERTRKAIDQLDVGQRTELLKELIGERSNRRHRPGRGFETVSYRFEIVSDYGAFRDLQRHRMLTVQWQRFGPELGAELPDELADAGVLDSYRRGLEISHSEYSRLSDRGLQLQAPYALCLAYRIRYILELNAREAMHLIELRSGREGHPGYRAVAHAMHTLIAKTHPAIAAAMNHIDLESEPRLERLAAEIREEGKRERLA